MMKFAASIETLKWVVSLELNERSYRLLTRAYMTIAPVWAHLERSDLSHNQNVLMSDLIYTSLLYVKLATSFKLSLENMIRCQ